MDHYRILLVDDDKEVCDIIKVNLYELSEDYSITIVHSAEEALDKLSVYSYDVMVTDVRMPGMDGLQLIEKAKELQNHMQIIIMTAYAHLDDAIRAMRSGAINYIKKPFESEILHLAIQKALEKNSLIKELHEKNKKITRLNNELEDKVKERTKELAEAYDKLSEYFNKIELLSRTDTLTQLPNRRGALERLKHEIVRSERSGKEFITAILDIDDFNKINREFGSEYGDELIITTAKKLKILLRKQDCIARWEADSFILILPETERDGGEFILKKLCEKISKADFNIKNMGNKITVTIGAVTNNNAFSTEEIIALAEKNMVKGKAEGKNQVVFS